MTVVARLETLAMVAGVLSLPACATAYVQGQADLRGGRPADARRHFEQALARRPDRLDALGGLAVAEYKLGAFDRALPLFERVVSRQPNSGEAPLCLALTHLQLRDLGGAGTMMTEARQLGLPGRTVAEIDRALALLEPGLTDAVRLFIALSLEGDLEWAAEVHDARTAPRAWLEPTWSIYSDSHAVYPHIHGVP
jgi:tetratricopeptide (TPR) repeat protein